MPRWHVSIGTFISCCDQLLSCLLVVYFLKFPKLVLGRAVVNVVFLTTPHNHTDCLSADKHEQLSPGCTVMQ